MTPFRAVAATTPQRFDSLRGSLHPHLCWNPASNSDFGNILTFSLSPVLPSATKPSASGHVLPSHLSQTSSCRKPLVIQILTHSGHSCFQPSFPSTCLQWHFTTCESIPSRCSRWPKCLDYRGKVYEGRDTQFKETIGGDKAGGGDRIQRMWRRGQIHDKSYNPSASSGIHMRGCEQKFKCTSRSPSNHSSQSHPASICPPRILSHHTVNLIPSRSPRRRSPLDP